MIQSIRRSYLIPCSFLILVAVGCGDDGPGESSVVHSREDRLKYIAEMEAMEKTTEQMMTEQEKEESAP